MVGPPAVAWVIRPSRVHRLIVIGVLLCAALAILAYLTLQPWGISSLFIVLALSASALLAWVALRRESTGSLVWDGAHWLWCADNSNRVCTLACMLDLQRWMLLRVRIESGKRVWVWAESGAKREPWRAFRRAVVFGRVGVAQEGPLGM